MLIEQFVNICWSIVRTVRNRSNLYTTQLDHLTLCGRMSTFRRDEIIRIARDQPLICNSASADDGFVYLQELKVHICAIVSLRVGSYAVPESSVKETTVISLFLASAKDSGLAADDQTESIVTETLLKDVRYSGTRTATAQSSKCYKAL